MYLVSIKIMIIHSKINWTKYAKCISSLSKFICYFYFRFWTLHIKDFKSKILNLWPNNVLNLNFKLNIRFLYCCPRSEYLSRWLEVSEYLSPKVRFSPADAHTHTLRSLQRNYIHGVRRDCRSSVRKSGISYLP